MNYNGILRKTKYILTAIRYLLLYPVGRFIYKNRNVYLVSERGTDAGDNGYYMYRYLREKHPELESYYVIERKSPSVDKVLSFGNVVWRGSLRHYLLFSGARYKISTHVMGYSPNLYLFNRYYQLFPMFGKNIFLQHGIIKDNLVSLYRENTPVDLFICGAKPEFDYVSKHFHYINGEVKYTGLARFDGLYNIQTKRQILIMPTWRFELKTATLEDVRDSTYVRCWNDVLQSLELQEIIEEYDVDIVFYPHYEMQRYLSLFNSSWPRVRIIGFADTDVQKLLKESLILITDYSSVYFDFAYMKKPIIYFQFDREEFFAKHYARGYFDYDNMGFGPVAVDVHALFKELNTCAGHGFSMEEIYLHRTEGFFPLHDRENCERIFQAIVDLPS